MPIIFLIGLFGGQISMMMFGLEYEGTSLNPTAVWITIISTMAALVAYGILWGKDWAIKLGVPYAYLAFITSIIGFMLSRGLGGFTVPFEPFLLIFFIIALNKNTEAWNNFNPDQKEPISNQ
jgi:hypothetical protein